MVHSPTPSASSVASGSWRRHVVLLAFGTFVVGTDAFVMAGLLPLLARSLHVGVASAGQVVSVFSLGYALLSPVLAALTAHWSRRAVLVTALSVFAAGNAATALAPGYGWVLAARLLAAAGAAMFTPNASAIAAALAGPAGRGRAIALVTAGLTASLVCGAPLGTAIGHALGWRATMWCVAGLAVAAAPAVALRLPTVRGVPAVALRRRLAPLADRRVVRALAGTVLVFTGIYLPYTYVTAVFGPAIGGGAGRLALLLFAFGVTGTAGSLTAGLLADRGGPRRVIAVAMAVLVAAFLAMPAGRSSITAAVALTAVSGWASWSVTGPQQQRLMELAPGAESLVVSLNAAALYLAVSLSGAVGAVALRGAGAGRLTVLAAAFVVLAAPFMLSRGRARRLPPRQRGPRAERSVRPAPADDHA